MSTQDLNKHFITLIDDVIARDLLPKKRDLQDRLNGGFTEDLIGDHSLVDFEIANLRTLQIYLKQNEVDHPETTDPLIKKPTSDTGYRFLTKNEEGMK